MNKRFLLLLIMTISILALAPAVALAAPIPDELHLSLWPEYDDNQILFLQGVRYPESTPLPIEVKMAVPKGMTVIWVGELMGGEASQDIAVTHQTNPKDDYDEVVFTMTKSRIGQLEAKWTGLQVNGKERTINLEWVQRYESKLFTLDMRAPTQATDIKMSPPATNAPGGSAKGQEFISVAPMNLAVGQKQNFTITYQRSIDTPSASDQQAQQPQGAAGGGGTSSASNTAMIVIVVALITVAMFTVYKMHNRAPAAHTPTASRQPRAPKQPAPPAPADDEQNFFD